MSASAIPTPTRHNELWRYSDLAAVARLWPPAPARLISLAPGAEREEVIRIAGGGIHDVRVELAAGASLRIAFLLTSPDYARVDLVAHLKQGASFDMGGVILSAGKATQEIVTRIHHDENSATSHQRIRAVVDDRATATYMGRITVERHAQKTDGDQSTKALVLKRTATANMKPELVIYADDVKAAHGCSIGELDKMALFYLQSRGVPPGDAEALLTEAFLKAAYAGLRNEAERDALEAEAISWLRRNAGITDDAG